LRAVSSVSLDSGSQAFDDDLAFREKDHAPLDFRASAAARMRGGSPDIGPHNDLGAITSLHDFSVPVLRARADVRGRPGVPNGLPVHAGLHSSTRVHFRHNLPSDSDLRPGTDMHARMAMLAGNAAHAGTAAAAEPVTGVRVEQAFLPYGAGSAAVLAALTPGAVCSRLSPATLTSAPAMTSSRLAEATVATCQNSPCTRSTSMSSNT
jgi:hypothetical protein